ncbi:MAG: hypothetical protein C0473_00430 [Cyanobacteria bacterium DS3.002]|nr:hypothetical protein [Cyanobacteria bacterium DS3.002]MBA4050095.1 hypothetical protein [Cyanobacteria bacterium DS2.008]MBA4075227.1 hypothetical protein [Cyanobacteria bacterium PR.023]
MNSESDSEKLRKRQDKERRRESEAVRKRLVKAIVKQQKEKLKPESKPDLKKQDTKDLVAKELNPQDSNQEKKSKRQEPKKPDALKLKEASESRRKGLKGIKEKPKRPVSEKEKSLSTAVKDDKKARLSEHLKQKAASRASLDKQKASLEGEVKALNKLSSVRETIDGQYTARFSGFESAIAAGPMGAASTGLRKLNPSILIDMKRAEAGAKVQNKIEPMVAQKLAKIMKVAKNLKLSGLKEFRSAQTSKVQAMKEALVTDQKIQHSKLRSKIKEMKTKEKMRDPNREPTKVDELNMPYRGVGGTGGNSGQ